MLDPDIHINILKYLDVYEWNTYINLSRQMNKGILRNLNLVKKIFRKKNYPKMVSYIENSYRCNLPVNNERLIIDLHDEFGVEYKKRWDEKYPDRKNEVQLQNFDPENGWGSIYIYDFAQVDREILTELYKEYGDNQLFGIEFTEIPYEYYVYHCYRDALVWRERKYDDFCYMVVLDHEKMEKIRLEKKVKKLQQNNDISEIERLKEESMLLREYLKIKK